MRHTTLLALLALGLHACQQLDDENIADTSSHTLTLRTRASNAIDYPAYLYIFNEAGQCVDTQTISDTSQSISSTLPNGMYNLYVFAGVGNSYQLPSGHATTDKIQIKTGDKATTALSAGNQSINLTSDTNVAIALQYMTTKIEACITNVPDDYTTVAFKLSPVYSAITLNGEYTNAGQTLEATCKKDNLGNWISDSIYSFPGSNVQTTITIILEKKDGSKTHFDYTYHGSPQANHPFQINANFANQSKMAITLSMGEWSTTTTVNFNFGNEQTTPTSNTIKESEIPTVRDLWNEGIVFDTQQDDNKLKITVLDLYESPQAILTSDVATHFSFEEGWRLPTFKEAELLNARFANHLGEINQTIQDYYTLKTNHRYLCTKEGENNYYTYSFKVGSNISKAGEKTKYLGRMVKDYNYTIEPE
ncbi:MAG: hypothetical protein Q4E55_05385 [Bacteroidales bacterium]|nr:hypothetical protein [Bacteroidales bacterium]